MFHDMVGTKSQLMCPWLFFWLAFPAAAIRLVQVIFYLYTMNSFPKTAEVHKIQQMYILTWGSINITN